jgi:hypothetical protein
MNRTSLAFVALAIALATSNAFADAKSKEDKIRRLATMGGITSRLDEQVGQVLSDGRKTEDSAMAQINANLDVPASFRPKFDEANKRLTAAIQPQWTTFEVIDLFTRAYSPMVSEEDVDAQIAFQNSDVGKRNAAALQEATNQIAAMIAARSGNRVQVAVQAYITEMRSLIAQCNCAKKAPPPAK